MTIIYACIATGYIPTVNVTDLILRLILERLYLYRLTCTTLAGGKPLNQVAEALL